MEVLPMIRLRRCSVFVAFKCLIAMFLCSLPVPRVAAQNATEKPAAQWIVDRKLNITPQPVSVPVLKYRLFPVAVDLKEGNAIPIFLRLAHEQNDATRQEWKAKPAEWNQLPIKEIPIKEARQFLSKYAYLMKQLEIGARRKSADWDYTLDAGDPIAILLPDAQWMRVYGAMLLLQARVEIAEGNYAAAAHTLETGFAFSRHIIEGPFLINGLVGIAIANLMTEALFDWVSQPGSPNLYWSITALPRPFADLRKEYDFEYRMLEFQFPDLADLKRERSTAEWDAVLKRVRTEFDRIQGLDKESNRFPSLPHAAPTEPAAKSPELLDAQKYLVEKLHLPADKVNAMPPAQVILLCLKGIMDDARDDHFKAAYLAMPEGLAVGAAAEKRLKSMPNSEITRLPAMFLPAIPKVIVAVNRLDRKIAALRIIEAIRLYAAAHDGQMPDKLADITEVPVPNDSGTGQPFEYERDKDTATLVAPPLKGAFDNITGQRYRLTIKGKG
jgi:hypothetical protein